MDLVTHGFGVLLLASLLPDGVCGAEVYDTGQVVAPADAALAPGASDARRRDFALGRACARAALAQAGHLAAGVIERAAHGAPLWPDGFTGSITHTSGYAAAIAARTDAFAGLGVDAERADRVEEGLFTRLFDAGERAFLAAHRQPRAMAALLFSAKEAAFKASNPPAGAALHFQQLHIEVRDESRFGVDTMPDACGRYLFKDGLVLTCLWRVR